MLNKISLKHTTLQLVVALCTMTVLSCSNDEDSELSPDKLCPISFSIEQVGGMQTTRTMIENATDLQNACTPKDAGNANYLGEAIGLWGDYTVTDENGNTSTYPNFFGNGNIALIYKDKPDGNPNSYWNYEGNALYWVIGGKYKFRAYYPQEAIKDHVLESSNATTFIIDYNTMQLQRDLLVGYKDIDTENWNLNNPVPIRLRHAMAALQFKFQFEDNLVETDYLTSCWLQNTEERDFSNVAMLAYGDETNPNRLRWEESYQPPVTQKMYYWEHPRNNENPDGGILIENNSTNDKKIAVAYCEKGSSGDEFTNNNGWLMIIPQQSDGTVQLCFTTYEGGQTIYKVPLPIITGTDLATLQANSTTDSDGNFIIGSAIKTDGNDFVPGYRYTYTITISKTDMDIKLSIAKWNELKSSFDISF